MSIDAHLHVWDPRALRYPWLDHEPDLNAPFLPSDVHSEKVDGVVFVQADAADGLAEAEWVQSLEWPQLHGIVAFAPVEGPELPTSLEHLEKLPAFVGVRRLLQDEPEGFIASDSFAAGLTVLAERDIPFDACIRHTQLAELVAAAERVPEIIMVLDHLGKPPVRAGWHSEEAAAWRAALEHFAALPRTVVKVSGLAPEADPDQPLAEQIAPFVETALGLFGPRRLMIGSDFPVSAATPHRLEYDDWFALADELIDLSPSERHEAFTGTAERTYRERRISGR